MTGVKDKTIIVTGAASGVGKEVAQLIAARGGSVISLDRNAPEFPVARHIEIDLADPAQIDAVVAQLDGCYDGLANVAGVAGTMPAKTVFRVNFLGLRRLTEAMMPRIADTGSIVNVSSIAGAGWPLRLDLLKELLALEGFDEAEAWLEANAPADVPHYNFSKEIVTTYTILSAMKRLPGGPRINAVCPGVIETPLLPDFRASMGAELIDHVATMTGRHATPNDVAEVVLFLLSDASRWIKGRALTVDGGTMTAADLGFAVAPETAAA